MNKLHMDKKNAQALTHIFVDILHRTLACCKSIQWHSQCNRSGETKKNVEKMKTGKKE